MENFLSFGLPPQLLQALHALEFQKPTPIQAKVIPEALEGKDIVGSAQTGTGKTAAFGIPLVAHLLANPQSNALVLTPTRELAVQVYKMVNSLLGPDRKGIRSALLIGGEAMFKQLQQLRSQPRLVVGTPGRLNDHLKRGTLQLRHTNFLVLDETDRMLDMGFTPQIDAIIAKIPEERQTLMFSATLPKNIMKMSQKYLKEPIRISVDAPQSVAQNLQQEILHVSEGQKHEKLIAHLESTEGSVIVFVKTKIGADRMAKRLREHHHSADAIHGDLRHNQRERVIRGFRDSKYRIMVATDIAARGLDIAHVQHVINYDLPQCPEDYIHRIGRTARAGASGFSLCFIAPSDKGKWKEIAKLMNPAGSDEKSNPQKEISWERPNARTHNRGSKGRRFVKKSRFGSPKTERNTLEIDPFASFKPKAKPRFSASDPSKFGERKKKKFGDKPRFTSSNQPKFEDAKKFKFAGAKSPQSAPQKGRSKPAGRLSGSQKKPRSR